MTSRSESFERAPGKHRLALRLAAVLTLLVLSGLVIAFLQSRRPPIIQGGLSESDAEDIIKLVRHDMWRRSFPDASWRTVRSAPGSLYRLAAARILEVLVAPPGYGFGVQVTGTFGRGDTGKRCWLLNKGSKGWKIGAERQMPWFLVMDNPVEGIGETLTNLGHLPKGRVTIRDDLQEVPLLLGAPGSMLRKSPPGDFDRGSGFSNWLSDHQSVSLDARH